MVIRPVEREQAREVEAYGEVKRISPSTSGRDLAGGGLHGDHAPGQEKDRPEAGIDRRRRPQCPQRPPVRDR
ncbi:protein of unknown function [Candidatus Promineifilum breve]|uniref:Uncharacterized protein n=1 Tax=Candidatus Promineifilum breve TaxID=1806508 RepID=A0A170PFI6_9CHLR|nr:protein of unknown function [Candidatus Promineifilum breve]